MGAGGGQGHDGQFSREPLPVFSAGGHCEELWHEQGHPLFDVVHPAYPLPTTVLPTLKGALKDGFGDVVLACNMPKPCKFPSLDSCQKRFLWTQNGVDLVPHPIIVLVLQTGDVKKFPQAVGFKGLDPFLRVCKQGPCFTSTLLGD